MYCVYISVYHDGGLSVLMYSVHPLTTLSTSQGEQNSSQVVHSAQPIRNTQSMWCDVLYTVTDVGGRGVNRKKLSALNHNALILILFSAGSIDREKKNNFFVSKQMSQVYFFPIVNWNDEW